jgi:hypothetical protein
MVGGIARRVDIRELRSLLGVELGHPSHPRLTGKTGRRRRAGLAASQPSALRTIVALSCLDLLIVHTGVHRSVLTSIRDVLLSALCTDANGRRRNTFPPPTAEVAPAWLLDAYFYFQHSGDEQCVVVVCLTPSRQSARFAVCGPPQPKGGSSRTSIIEVLV